MRFNNIKYCILIIGIFLNGCSGGGPSKYGPVRIETHPLNGICHLNGKDYHMIIRSPADLVVPISATPVSITCKTNSGYKGTSTLNTIYDTWSPANIGSLGLGYLVDKYSGKGRRYPEALLVTMNYKESKAVNRPPNVQLEKPGKGMLHRRRRVTASTSTIKEDNTTVKESPIHYNSIPKIEKRKTTKNDIKFATNPTSNITNAAKSYIAAGTNEGNVDDGSVKIPTQKMLPNSKKMLNTPTSNVHAHVIHLSSFKNRKNAENSWNNLHQKYGNLLKGLSATVKNVKLRDKGSFHRVYAGPLKNASAAQILCKKLKLKGVYCRPVALGSD